MLAITAERPFSREGWWFETKWDGYRAIISVGRTFHIYSRRGHDLAAWYPAVAAARRTLPDDIVLDAELVAWVDGRPVFSELQQRTASQYLLMVFDCLYSNGRWLLHEPLSRRQAELRRRVAPGGIIVLSDGLEGQGESFFHAVSELGLEGVMAKRLDSRYLPGRRVPAWQKFLARQAEWFWATAFSEAADGTWYWRLSEQKEGRMRSVGRVHAPSNWRPLQAAPGLSQLAMPFLVEVEYRERTREGQLRHARIRQWRHYAPAVTSANPPPGKDPLSGGGD